VEDAENLPFETKDQEAKFILIAGKPINEPVFQYGPFVMDTQEGLMKTFDDYQNFKNGFENAKNCTSNIKNLAN